MVAQPGAGEIFVSDHPELNSHGYLRSHACNMIFDDSGNLVIAVAGDDAFYQLAMPEGFRILGYTMTLKNDIPSTFQEASVGYGCKFSETTSGFSTELTSITVGSSREDSKEYNISRTVLNPSDATNVLNFKLERTGSSLKERHLRIVNFVVYFSADGDKPVNMAPETNDATAKSHVEVPFETGKLALGDVRLRKQGGAVHNAYEYHEVEELNADMTLYNEGSVVGGKVETWLRLQP